jgi:serine/threonine protein kinase
VAVKVLHPHLSQQTDFTERFLREARAIASLQHPNIVQIYDFEFLDGNCYMAMEFLNGRSLEEQLKDLPRQGDAPQPLPLNGALKIIIEVARALEFAHKQGIVHRDIKPANIMRTQEGRIVLTDFGIATLLHETRLTVEGTTTGTPHYMSPEQALGERGDERSDIYSLGAVLYQLVTGRLPFEADTMYGLIMQHINDPPPPAARINPNVPKEVEQIICKAMEKEPARRYRTAREFAADLEAVLKGEQVEVDLSTRPLLDISQAMASLSKSRTKVGWIAFAVAVVAILVGVRVMSSPPVADSQTLPGSAEEVDSMAAKNPDEGVDSMAAPGEVEPLIDAFANNDLGWLTTDGLISRQVVDGVYLVSIEEPNRAIAAYPERGDTYYDFSHEAEATLIEGPTESGYGLVFRRQDDENYYVFAINGLRQWSVWRLEDRAWHELRALPGDKTWTPADAVLPSGELNRLRVEAIGPEITLYVNDQRLDSITDDTFASGGIGFYMASSRTAGAPLARVRFDNVALTPLADSGVSSMTSDGASE